MPLNYPRAIGDLTRSHAQKTQQAVLQTHPASLFAVQLLLNNRTTPHNLQPRGEPTARSRSARRISPVQVVATSLEIQSVQTRLQPIATLANRSITGTTSSVRFVKPEGRSSDIATETSPGKDCGRASWNSAKLPSLLQSPALLGLSERAWAEGWTSLLQVSAEELERAVRRWS